MRFRISDQHDETELDLDIGLPRPGTRGDRIRFGAGPARVGGEQVLGSFDRSEPRDFIDLAALSERFELEELIALAREKDPGLDLEVLDVFMARVRTPPRADFEHDDRAHQGLLRAVDGGRSRISNLRGSGGDLPSQGA